MWKAQEEDHILLYLNRPL